MSWIRPWKSAIELRHLPEGERFNQWKLTHKRLSLWPGAFMALANLGVGGIIIYFNRLWHITDRSNILAVYGCSTAIVANVFIAVRNRHVRRMLEADLRKEFAGRHLPTCLHCEYSLQGVADSARVCPECGNEDIHGAPIVSE